MPEPGIARMLCRACAASAFSSTIAVAQAFDFERTDYAAGNAPCAIAAADFDQDGAIDIALADESTSAVLVLFGQGSGSLGAAVAVGGVGARPRGLIAADLDADGRVDLATASFATDSIRALRNVGGGAFAVLQPVPVLERPRWVDGADFDGDGALDLATPHAGVGALSVVHGQLGGSFGHLTTPGLGGSVSGSLHVATSDLDLDGDADLCVGTGPSFGYTSLMNGGSPAQWSPVFTGTAHGVSEWVSTGDVTADGIPDLLITSNDLGDYDTSLFAGAGTGALSVPSLSYLEVVKQAVHGAADLDGDGRVDMVLAQSAASLISPALLRVHRTSSPAPSFVTTTAVLPAAVQGLLIADIDLDGALDIATLSREPRLVSVFLQRAPLAPAISSTSPASVVSLQSAPGTLDLFGVGLTTLESVSFNGVAQVNLGYVQVFGDTHARVRLKNPVGVGPTTAIGLTTSGGSTTVQVPLLAPPSPLIYATNPFSKSSLQPDLYIGAAAGDLAFVLAATDLGPSILPGIVELAIGDGIAKLIPVGKHVLPQVGWLPIDLNVSGLPLGTDLHVQLAVLASSGGLPLLTSNFVSGTVNL